MKKTQSPPTSTRYRDASPSDPAHQGAGALDDVLRSPEAGLIVNIDSDTSWLRPSKWDAILKADPKRKSDESDSSLQIFEPTNKKKKKKTKKLFVNPRNGEEGREHDPYPVGNGRKDFFIFNFKSFSGPAIPYRQWTEHDIKNLKEVFERQMHYTLETNLNDLDRSPFFSKLDEIRHMKKLNDTEVFILSIMSHGDGTARQNFITRDDKSVSMNQVCAFFDNVHCPQLRGTPKIFLCCFCRNLEKAPESSANSVVESGSPDTTPAAESGSPDTTPAVESGTPDTTPAVESGTPDTTPAVEHALRETAQIDVSHLTESGINSLLLLGNGNDISPENIHQILAEMDLNDLKSVSELINQAENDQNSETVSESNKAESEDCSEAVNQASNESENSFEWPIYNRKNCTDMMIIHSCKEGLRSARTNKHGTIFIDALCRSVAEHACHYNVDRIFADVEEKMREICPDECDSLEGYDPDKNTTVFKTCYLF